MATMRFRIWHLLASMATVALWAPLAQGLLALEAQDHSSKPQTTADFIGFYLGAAALACLPWLFAWMWVSRIRNKRLRDSSFTNFL